MDSVELTATHVNQGETLFNHFADCDEIWHAGDIGNLQTADQLKLLKTIRAVYGNIDGNEIRSEYPEVEIFNIENVKVLMIHIGGYPGRYSPTVKKLIADHKPDLFISGHSHILKVLNDQKNGLLHINPGAAGKHGLHKMITMVRFAIDGEAIKDLEIFEAKR